MNKSVVEKYWNKYTIADNDSNKFTVNIEDSINHIKTIDRLYPLYMDLFDLFKEHDNKIILDYGCGPANDLLGFALYSKCKKIIGIDISSKALHLATNRLNLHNILITDDVTDKKGITLIKTSENDNKINIASDFVDYIQSTGVIHHTSNPVSILKELYRILKPNCIAKFMMYHRNSLYVRLTLTLELLRKNINMDVYDYFEKTGRADSGAPIAFLSDNEDFVLMGEQAGFKTKFIDCAFSIADLRSVLDIPFALYNNNFPEKHKEFLRNITYYKANNIDISNNYKNISLEIDRLYEIEITVNNLYYILPLRYTFDGLTDKGYYEEPCNYNIIISTGEFTIKKKLYSFKDVINITEYNNNFINSNIKITQIYPSYNGYNPGMNAIYEFTK
jgi:SAM-dependent methyltransferase